MVPYEVMLSESQERMLIIVDEKHQDDAEVSSHGPQYLRSGHGLPVSQARKRDASRLRCAGGDPDATRGQAITMLSLYYESVTHPAPGRGAPGRPRGADHAR